MCKKFAQRCNSLKRYVIGENSENECVHSWTTIAGKLWVSLSFENKAQGSPETVPFFQGSIR